MENPNPPPTAQDDAMDTASSSDTSTSRKRRRDAADADKQRHSQQQASDDEDTAQTSSLQNMSLQDKEALLPTKLAKLRLEAIFHSKFDNEKRTDQVIRSEMLQNVQDEQGYLEVTLKHSGSLVLWSGGQRFYSKNSTSNQFTYTAEILLRQHFYRAWYNQDESRTSTGTTPQFQECSDYAEENRLTLAFEVVTAVLGDHGDIPNRDFIILTAIADRANERFFSTTEVLELAQRFRLPHNDSWICTSHSSVRELFQFYDTKRETALAKETCDALDRISDAHVASMYPHDIFQGDILEGIIIRYVPYRDQMRKPNVTQVMNQLSDQASRILEQVPPSLEPCFSLVRSNPENVPKVYTTDIQTLFHDIGGAMKRTRKTFAELDKQFSECLAKVLEESTGSWRRVEKIAMKDNFLSLTTALTNSPDLETRRAAEMLQTLGNLKSAVHYTIFKEDLPSESRSRFLCIIHVLYDATFQKFRNSMSPAGMPLFRGFCLELINETDPIVGGDADVLCDTINDIHTEKPFPDHADMDSGALMLKMKFLPYMVRTFICRNKLRLAMKEDPEEFLRVAAKQLNTWGISDESKQKWIPFFERWACYARGPHDHTNNLPPLSEFSYLRHLDYLQHSGPNSFKPSGTVLEGFIIFVGPTSETAKTAAKYISEQLGGVKFTHGKSVVTSLTPRNLCFLGLGDTSKQVKKLLSTVEKYSVVVMVGCSEEELGKQFADSAGDLKKSVGLSKFWKSVTCGTLVELPTSVFQSQSDDDTAPYEKEIEDLLAIIKESAKDFPAQKRNDLDMKPGALIFFPVIPGFGKSAILDTGFARKVEKDLDARGTLDSRKVKLKVGDKMSKKFWKIVEQDAIENPSTILLADKNSPPVAWTNVGRICEGSRMLPLPVLPSSETLKTTTIKGARDPADGSLFSEESHYYPFSLAFLAVCMARVLNRPPSSHAGKLDSGTPQACMIVILFYTFYRRISAEEFNDEMKRRLSNDESVELLSPIQLPFLSQQLDVPTDLVDVLEEALQLQRGFDVKKIFKPSGDEATVVDMEKKLRESISKHSNMLLSSTVSLEESRSSFIDQLDERLGSIANGTSTTSPSFATNRFIKLASLDVPMNDIHSFLREHSGSFAKSFLESTLTDKSLKKFLEGSTSSLVKTTHVTMAFHDQTTREDMLRLFGDAIGSEVEVTVQSILWSDRVAALGVDPSRKSLCGKTIPLPQNEFPHITIWFKDNAKASEANNLPSMVESGQAMMEVLENPVKLTGKLSFWGKENKPLDMQT